MLVMQELRMMVQDLVRTTLPRARCVLLAVLTQWEAAQLTRAINRMTIPDQARIKSMSQQWSQSQQPQHIQ